MTTYSYYAFNQTTQAVTKDGNTLVSRYDAEGLRAEIEDNDILSREIKSENYYYHEDVQGILCYI